MKPILGIFEDEMGIGDSIKTRLYRKRKMRAKKWESGDGGMRYLLL